MMMTLQIRARQLFEVIAGWLVVVWCCQTTEATEAGTRLLHFKKSCSQD